MEFKRREVKTPKFKLTLELIMHESTFTEEELYDKIGYLIDNPYYKEFSAFIVSLLRETHSSVWEIGQIEIKEIKR